MALVENQHPLLRAGIVSIETPSEWYVRWGAALARSPLDATEVQQLLYNFPKTRDEGEWRKFLVILLEVADCHNNERALQTVQEEHLEQSRVKRYVELREKIARVCWSRLCDTLFVGFQMSLICDQALVDKIFWFFDPGRVSNMNVANLSAYVLCHDNREKEAAKFLRFLFEEVWGLHNERNPRLEDCERFFGGYRVRSVPLICYLGWFDIILDPKAIYDPEAHQELKTIGLYGPEWLGGPVDNSVQKDLAEAAYCWGSRAAVAALTLEARRVWASSPR